MTTSKYQGALQELSYHDFMFLLSLSKTQNLAQSARDLAFSSSSASRRLAHLRGVFHDDLFVRSGQVMVPSPRMLELLPQMECLLEETSSLFERSVFDIAQSERMLRVAVSDHLFHSLFTRAILHSFFTAAPRAIFSMQPSDNHIFERLRENTIDMAFYIGSEIPKEEFRMVELYRGRYGIFVRSDHPLVEMGGLRRTVTKEQIALFQAVQFNYMDGPNSDDSARMRQAMGQRVGVITPYSNSIPMIVEETNFTFVGPLVTLNRFLQMSKTPERFAILNLAEDYSYFVPKLIWHRRSHSDPFLQWARSVIIDTCRTEGQELDKTLLT